MPLVLSQPGSITNLSPGEGGNGMGAPANNCNVVPSHAAISKAYPLSGPDENVMTPSSNHPAGAGTGDKPTPMVNSGEGGDPEAEGTMVMLSLLLTTNPS